MRIYNDISLYDFELLDEAPLILDSLTHEQVGSLEGKLCELYPRGIALGELISLLGDRDAVAKLLGFESYSALIAEKNMLAEARKKAAELRQADERAVSEAKAKAKMQIWESMVLPQEKLAFRLLEFSNITKDDAEKWMKVFGLIYRKNKSFADLRDAIKALRQKNQTLSLEKANAFAETIDSISTIDWVARFEYSRG